MAGYDLGQAHGEITIDYKEGGAKEAAADLEAVDQKGKKAADSTMSSAEATKKLSSGMMVVGGAAVGALALAVRSATNFEDALAGVRAAGNASAAEMEKLRAKALQLGADTKFSSTEAAGAMEALIKAGLSTNDVLDGAADAAVNLAAAERLDLTKASEIAATAMTAFNLQAKDMPKIADTISRAASATKMDVSDFAQAMNQAGAVSKLVGLSFDDMALAITAMGKSGIIGSDAGTSLKTMLMNLQPQTKKQSELMSDLGIITKDGANQFFTATGKIKSMTDIAGVLAGALKGMSEEQKIATLQTLFGSDAIRAAAIIADQGAGGMQNLTKEMGSQLSVAEKAKIQMGTFKGTLENLKGSVETLAINLGKILLPILDTLAKVVGVVVDWFNKLPGPVKDVAVWTLALGGMSLLAMGSILKMIKVVKDFITVLKALKEAQLLTLLTNPWFLLAAAVVIVAALIITHWQQVKDFLTNIFTVIGQFFITVWTAIATFFTNLWNTVIDWFINLWNTVSTWFFNLITTIGGFFVDLWTTVTQWFENRWNDVATFFTNLWNSIWNFITGILSDIGDFFTRVWNGVIDGIRNFIGNVMDFFHNLKDNITNFFSNAGSWLYNAGRDIILGIWHGIQDMVNWVLDRISDVGNWISDRFNDVLSIFSPSKVFAYSGEMTMRGLIVGVERTEGDVLGTYEQMAQKIVTAGDPSQLSGPQLPAGMTATGTDGAATPTGTGAPIVVNGLTLQVAGNLDPTNPTEFRKAIVQIKKGIESVTKESR